MCWFFSCKTKQLKGDERYSLHVFSAQHACTLEVNLLHVKLVGYDNIQQPTSRCRPSTSTVSKTAGSTRCFTFLSTSSSRRQTCWGNGRGSATVGLGLKWAQYTIQQASRQRSWLKVSTIHQAARLRSWQGNTIQQASTLRSCLKVNTIHQASTLRSSRKVNTIH